MIDTKYFKFLLNLEGMVLVQEKSICKTDWWYAGIFLADYDEGCSKTAANWCVLGIHAPTPESALNQLYEKWILKKKS